ncbi:SPL family radical SAM protein [Desulfallas thermosapovorans]|uniref:DNA repair photolyase n=1 Tax=Desulfallas thermosapovorans DSM 6562 TaxID=1121431 RepID=A0A5S4ZY48_9FIRM|nr:radical SAM protein [Desulfallas thermosapovorans]TYO98011.1 DNA repair photolyase [Desulfallas thermosapovorans DSM 6562]
MCDRKNHNQQVSLKFGKVTKTFPLVELPCKHIVVKSAKELHGWWPGKRECTAERLLVNPYNGCTHNCAFCYAHAMWGYFNLYHSRKIVTVFEDFHLEVARQLDGLEVASCGYLSPVTDPFQPLNIKYQLSEKLIKVFVDRNLPIEFITKNVITDEALRLMEKQEHSFGQVSIITPDEELRRRLVPGGAPTEKLLDNLTRLKQAGKFAVCRIDPIIPGITDDERQLDQLVGMAVKAGADHIITSCMDIPQKIRPVLIAQLAGINSSIPRLYRELYTENLDGQWHVNINTRRLLFQMMSGICRRHGVSLALCMEYESVNGRVHGLNREFMTTRNCEGLDVPLYIRQGGTFRPVNCDGACLLCKEPVCGISELAGGGAWKLKDYRRWSKQIKENKEPRLF